MVEHHQHSFPATAPHAAKQFDPWIIWVTFRRCWPWAIPTGAVLAAMVAFYVMKDFQPRYQASALLEANRDYLVFDNVMPSVDNLARTEQAMFFNPIVLDPILADAGLREAPSLSDPETAEMQLRRNLSISNAGNTHRLSVSYTDLDPAAAALVCNAIVESYLRQRDAFDNSRISNLERWLEPEIARWEQNVEEKQQIVHDLSERTLGFAPGQRLSVMEDQNNLALLADLRSQITDLEVQLSVEDAQRAMSRSESNAQKPVIAEFVAPEYTVQRHEPTEAEIEAVVNTDPDVQESMALQARYKSILVNLEDSDLVRVRREYYEEMQAKLASHTEELETLKAAAREKAVETLQAKADEDLEIRKKQVAAQIEAQRQAFLAQQKQAQVDWQQQRDADVAAEKQAREELLAKLDVLRKQYDEERSRLEQFGGATAELQFAQEELSVASEVLRKLRDRAAAIRTERRQDGAVRTLAEATPPKSPMETLPMKKLLTTCGGAFMVPFLIGLLFELKAQRLVDSTAVERHLSLAPVVGEVARLPTNARGGRARRVFEESIDSLRANLFLSLDRRDIRSIAVASSMSGEGKSSVASQLAISIAKATGETVLLVDADLRCPDQHDVFGLEMGPGLSGVLSGRASLEEAADTSLGDLIHVLPAGKLSTSPHRLISPASMRSFVDNALEKYHYIVFDTAPVLSAGETLSVSAAVDSTLLCVMRDVSRVDNVTRTTQRLQAAGATIAGTVFSGVTARQYAYRYGDYHYALPSEAEA